LDIFKRPVSERFFQASLNNKVYVSNGSINFADDLVERGHDKIANK
jgi:hypothetical protein